MHKFSRLLLAIPALLACTDGLKAAGPVAPLVASQNAVTVSWQKGAGGAPGSAGAATNITVTLPTTMPVGVTATSSFFVVSVPSNPAPTWLSVSPMFATANAASNTNKATLTFLATAVADTMNVGSYTTTVTLTPTPPLAASTVFNPSITIAVTLLVKEPVSTFSIQMSGSSSYQIGDAAPTFTISTFSSGDPISFTATPSIVSPVTPPNWLLVAAGQTAANSTGVSGIAYSFGGPTITVSFSPQVVAQVQPGVPLMGKVTFTSGGNTIAVANITLGVTIGASTIASVSPSVIAASTAPTNPVQVLLAGTNFSAGTTVFVTPVNTSATAAEGDTGVALPASAVTFIDNKHLVVSLPPSKITVASGTDKYIALDTVATGTQTIATVPAQHWAQGVVHLTTAPIISAIVNAASFNQQATNVNGFLNVAPYEIVSIFGDNFCPSVNDAPVISLDAQLRFPASVQCASDTKYTTVSFYSDNTGTALTTDPNAAILLLTKNQMNVVVPSTVTAGSPIWVNVTHSAAAPTNRGDAPSGTASLTASGSTYYELNAVTSDPAVFTTNASGQGQGAILNYDWNVNSVTTQAAIASTAINGVAGNLIHIFLTGLGAPTTSSTPTFTTASAVAPATCIQASDYMGAINNTTPDLSIAAPGTAWATIDGAVFASLSPFNTANAAVPLPPCFAFSTAATVPANSIEISIGGIAAPITYAGFAGGAVTGLYQIDASVPTTLKAPTANAAAGTLAGQVPVVVSYGTAGSPTTNASQTVYMFIK